MNTLIARLNRRASSVSAAAVIISLSYLASRLLGLLRDRLLVAHFGIGPQTDAYTAAFRLPELLFTLLVSGAFAVAFIPIFTKRIEKDQPEKAWELSSTLLNLLMITTLILGLLSFLFADPLTTMLAPGFDPLRHQLTVELTRIMLITPFLFAISSLWGSVAQAYNRFVIFAMASTFYNIGIIAGILILGPSQGIFGVAYGVVLGAALQALLQTAGLIGLGFRYSASMNLKNPDVWKVIKLMVPRSIDQGIDQLSYIIETIIGSRLATGSLTSLYYANNLKNVPVALIGNSIATAAFPQMAARAAKGAIDKLVADFVINIRLILFFVVPAVILTVLMRGYIVRLLYGFGDATTANTLGWFAGVILLQGIFFLVSRMFYALQDTKTPLYVSLTALILNVGLSLGLSHYYGVIGLAMAQSLLALFETTILLVLLKRRLGHIGAMTIWRGLARMSIAGGVMAAVVYTMVSRVLPLYRADTGFAIVGPKFFLIVTLAAIAYLLPCYYLNLNEARSLYRRLKVQIERPLNLT